MKRLLLILLYSTASFAANHYVNTAAAGTGTGADWTNACTEFTGSCAIASLVRGDTYFVATGTYATRSWNRATSGSLVITIQRATVSAHGTDTGWNNAFDGVVTWGEQDFTTSFWTFNGVTFPVSASPLDGANVTSNYGFFFNHAANCNAQPDNIIGIAGASNVTIKGFAMATCGGGFDTDQWCFLVNPTSNNINLSHGYCVNSVDIVQMQGSDSISQDSIFEFIYSQNNGGSATHHGEAYQLVCTNCTIRYNWFADAGLSGGVTSVISGNAAGTATCGANIPMCNTQIYGNVFINAESGSGIIHAAGTTGIGGTHFYNNTIIHLTTGNYFDECTGHSCPAGSGNNIVENNLIWNSVCGIGGFGLAGDVKDFNTQLSCIGGAADSQTNGQTGNFNPFVNSAIQNFNLATNPVASCASSSATCGGLVLASPYNTDFAGTPRDSTGQWARGAFDIGGATQAVTPTFSPVSGTYPSPQSVAITSSTAAATMCYTLDGTAPTANGAGTCTHGTTLANGGTVSVSTSETVQALATLSGDTDSAVGSATYTIGTPVASLTPSSLSFGGVNISNTSAGQTLTLQNTGTAVMSITSISLAGANTGDFFQSNNCPVGSNLGNGSSCTITVTFTPLAVGSRTASVSVVDGASGSPHTSALSGTGVQASLASQMNSGVRLSGRVVVK